MITERDSLIQHMSLERLLSIRHRPGHGAVNQASHTPALLTVYGGDSDRKQVNCTMGQVTMWRKITQGRESEQLPKHLNSGLDEGDELCRCLGKTVPGRGDSQYKGPGRRACLVCLRNAARRPVWEENARR